MTPSDPALTDAAALAEVFDLFTILSRKAAELSSVQTAEGCLETLEKILRDPLRFELYQIRSVQADGKLAWSGGLKDGETGAFVDDGLAQWALKGTQPLLVPWEGGAVAGQDVKSLILIPVATHRRPYALILVWVSFDEGQSSRLLLQALENLARQAAFSIERLRREAQTQELRQLVDSILESVPLAILAIGKDDKVLACNRNLEFQFGVSRGEILGKPYKEAFPHAFAQVVESLILGTLQGEGATDFEYEHRLDDKTSFHLGVTSGLLSSPSDEPMGVLFVIRDLSLSREVVKLRELNEMKSQFVHTVSHELKTPLTAILGGCELLNLQADALNDDQKELVKIVDTGAKRLNALVADLLDLSRLESGRVHLEPVPVDLGVLAQEVAVLCQPRNPDAPITLDVDPNLPEPEADRGKIREVIENYVSNAMKYSPAGGGVTVRIWPEENEVRLEVTDQGMGIPAKHLPFLWDKFHRVDSAAMTNIEGTGLGLAIVKHIVEMHGGKVWVRSEEGKGSTFGFSLPA